MAVILIVIYSLCLQLSSLCEKVSSLTGSDIRSSAPCNPTTVIGAVSRLAQKHSEANDKLITITQQLEQVKQY